MTGQPPGASRAQQYSSRGRWMQEVRYLDFDVSMSKLPCRYPAARPVESCMIKMDSTPYMYIAILSSCSRLWFSLQ